MELVAVKLGGTASGKTQNTWTAGHAYSTEGLASEGSEYWVFSPYGARLGTVYAEAGFWIVEHKTDDTHSKILPGTHATKMDAFKALMKVEWGSRPFDYIRKGQPASLAR